MADIFSKQKRSEVMSKIRGKDTKPEMVVRRLVHSMGYRYKLHDRKLPGCPDLVFASRRKLVFCNGCFWHWHKGCPKFKMPSSRRKEFWEPKLRGNANRDRRNIRKLESSGWSVLVIWECWVRDEDWLRRQISAFLDHGRKLKPPKTTGRDGRKRMAKKTSRKKSAAAKKPAKATKKKSKTAKKAGKTKAAKGRMVRDLPLKTLQAIAKARKSGMTWNAIERKFGLKPTNGMTAYNAILRLERINSAK